MKCIACGHPYLSEILRLNNAPRVCQPLGIKQITDDKKITLTVLSCRCCHLVQLKKVPPFSASYYEDYLLDRTHSTFSSDYQKHIARYFVSTYHLRDKTVLEVGCGDGTFAALLKKNGIDITGIDPSAKACQSAREKGIRVIEGRLTNKTSIKNHFDGFAACQVLEHMSNPRQFLSDIQRMLSPGAVGMIEVPSLTNTMKDKRFYDFFPDHVAYYSIASLSRLLESVGFRIFELKEVMSNEYIVAFVEYVPVAGGALQTSYESHQVKVTRFLNELKGKNVALWGAGIRGIPLISFSGLNEKSVLYCIDSDPNKHGKYLPGSHIKVVSPDTIRRKPPDVVVITASFYTKDIISILRKRYAYTAKIALLFPEPSML